MKTNTTLRKPQFRRFMLLGSRPCRLRTCQDHARKSPSRSSIILPWKVSTKLSIEMQKEFEAANPDIKLKFTYVPFGELVSRTLQMAAVRKPPAISAVDNPDVLRVAKAGILKDISADVAQMKVWEDIYRDQEQL